MSIASIKVAAVTGLVASLLSAWTGDLSGNEIARTQPMKLAAIEGLYEGGTHVGLVGVGVLNPAKQSYSDGKDPFLFKVEIPGMLSLLATRSFDGYVPGIKNIIEGGYTMPDGSVAYSTAEKMAKGRTAISSLSSYRQCMTAGDTLQAGLYKYELMKNMPYFGYGYINNPEDVVPPVALNFYSFRIMVMLGGYFILFFAVVIFLVYKRDIARFRWLHYVALITIPLGYLATQVGWIVAEVGRQPWTIQDLLPVNAAISSLEVSSVKTTFFIFAFMFTVLLIAEIGIMLKEIKRGPETK